jgi:very-short-patch-repair endonuclease
MSLAAKRTQAASVRRRYNGGMRKRMDPITFARFRRIWQTRAEAVLWRKLRNRRLDGWKFRRQLPIGPFTVDFACLAARLVVEVDGDSHVGRQAYDVRRQHWLETRGFHVMRLESAFVVRSPDAACERILMRLRGCARSPFIGQ